MKTIFVTAAAFTLATGVAFAQAPAAPAAPTAPAPADPTAPGLTAPPAPQDPGTAVPMEQTPGAAVPVPGENSFTEDQARERLTEAGYTDVSTLTLDADGIWRGTALRAGQQVNVSLDFQGNVVEQ